MGLLFMAGERMQAVRKNCYRRIYDFCLRAKLILKGGDYYPLLEEYKRLGIATRDEVLACQESRLTALLRHANNNSSFYASRLEGIDLSEDSLGQLDKVPLLTRDDLQHSAESIATQPLAAMNRNSSGGSTGQPVNFYQDSKYRLHRMAMEPFFLSWHDAHVADKTAIFWGADRDIADQTWRERLSLRLSRNYFLNSFSVTDDKLKQFFVNMNQIKPSFVYGYASSLEQAAKYILRTGLVLDFKPVAVRSSAEKLTVKARKLIERAFSCKVLDLYGSREVSYLTMECPEGGIHTNDLARIIEIVDLKGKPVADGEVGYVAVTDLTNYGFPFIRYLNGDMAKRDSSQCKCGRPLGKIKEIAGRQSDFFVVGDESVHGEYFTHAFYDRPEIKLFQLIQHELNYFELKLVGDQGVIDTAAIERQLREKIGVDVRLDINIVDGIEKTSTGKYRFTISKVTAGA